MVSGNIMTGNHADVLGNMIYNLGNMGVLNLTYINNSTKVVGRNQNVTLFAYLTDDMGNTITGQNITFIVNGTFIGNVTSIEGYANLSYTTSNLLGVFSVTGDYTGHTDYLINIFNGQLVVKIATNSTIKVPENVKVGATTNISGVLSDEEGNSVANANISVDVGGKTYVVATDSNGHWFLSYKPTQIGNVHVSVVFPGNDNYSAFENNATFNVNKGQVNLEMIIINNTDGSVTIIANVVDEDKNPVEGYSVDFILNNKVIGYGITNSAGIAQITIPTENFTNDRNEITAISQGNENYGNSSVSIIFIKEIVNTTGNNGSNIGPSDVGNNGSGVGPGDVGNNGLDEGSINGYDDGNYYISDATQGNSKNSGANKLNIGYASMKKTGIGITAIVLLLLTMIGVGIRRKQ
jgi:hypothetical protein